VNAYYDEEDDDEDFGEDFDANELLNFSDYKNKRAEANNSLSNSRPQTANTAVTSAKPMSASYRQGSTAAGADFEVELDDDEDVDSDEDGWGDVDNYVPNTDDLNDFDYKNKDLNKCGDYELKRHKLNMDK
jgi:hypothetical protein